MSTFQERAGLYDRTVMLRQTSADEAGARDRSSWVDFVTANATQVVASLALVWVATVGLVVVNNTFVPLNLVPLIYMLPVVLAATQWGIVPGLVAAFAGAAAADFFFYPPLYSFELQNPQDIVDLLLYLLVAVVTSNLASRLKNEAIALRRREKEITELHAFSQGLAACLTSRDLIFAVQDYLSNTLRYRAVLIATAAAELVRSYPNQILGVEGHTDNSPLANAQWRNNHQLSIGRAVAVYDVLVTQNRIPPSQLFMVGHGSNHPLYSNATPAGRQRNNRVELVVYPDRAG